MFQKLLCLVLISILLPCHIFAWGYTGHQLVAELAMHQLSDATRVKVERILNGMTPAQAGNWMDEIRSDQAYRYTAPWHFVNIEPGESYKPAPNGDVITALNKAYTELQHIEKLTPEQVRFDVLVLFHLCGDLLQPLYVGYGSDKGGNTYQVRIMAGERICTQYPNNPFTAVNMFNKRSGFSYKPEDYLNGKTLCVTGVIKNYKGKPEIAVDKEEQVKVQ